MADGARCLYEYNSQYDAIEKAAMESPMYTQVEEEEDLENLHGLTRKTRTLGGIELPPTDERRKIRQLQRVN